MIHESQGLSLSFEASDYFAGVHAWLNDLESDRSLDLAILHNSVDMSAVRSARSGHTNRPSS